MLQRGTPNQKISLVGKTTPTDPRSDMSSVLPTNTETTLPPHTRSTSATDASHDDGFWAYWRERDDAAARYLREYDADMARECAEADRREDTLAHYRERRERVQHRDRERRDGRTPSVFAISK